MRNPRRMELTSAGNFETLIERLHGKGGIMNALRATESAALMRATRGAIFSMLFVLGVALLIVCPAAYPQGETPLFADDTAIEFTLAVPVRTLVNRARRRPEVDGYLEYTSAGGDTVRLDAEVRTRGRSRLEICDFPPLSINLRRRQVEGTLFAGQNRIKLVTLCKSSDRYEQYLLREQLAYSIYQQVSDYAYKTRFATVTYVDTDRDNRTTIAPAFFIEHIDSLADRTGMRPAELSQVQLGAHDPQANSIYTVYQFLIGNLDWSALRAAPDDDECCHNTDLLVPQDRDMPVIPVPYDFDMSGLLDTEYAEPNPLFRIRSVRQRVYRGFCSDNELLSQSIEKFVEARPAIDTLIRESRMDDENKEDMLEYLASGYDVITTPDELQTEIIAACRG